MSPTFQDSHFIYSFSPVPGINKLFIRLAEAPTAKVTNLQEHKQASKLSSTISAPNQLIGHFSEGPESKAELSAHLEFLCWDRVKYIPMQADKCI